MTVEQAVEAAYGHWNAGQNDQAAHLAQQVLQVWPEHAPTLHLLGLVAYSRGNLPVAIDFVQRACRAPGANAQFHSNLAEMCRLSGRLREAEEAGRRAVALDPKMTDAWSNLGIVLQEAGKLEESLNALRQVVRQQPDQPQHYNNLANTLKRLGRLGEARKHYETALELRPSYSEARSNLSVLLCDLGEMDAAKAAVRRAIDDDPRNAAAYVNAANIALAEQKPQEALQWTDKLLGVAPDNVQGLMARASAFMRNDQLNDALEAARQAVASAPESGEARNVLAQVLGRAERIDDSLAAFDEAEKLPCPQPEQIVMSRGNLLAETDRRDDAVAAFLRALEIAPHSAQAWHQLAELNPDGIGEAEIERMQGLLADPASQGLTDRIALHFALARVLLKRGRDDQGFAYLHEGNRLKHATISHDAEATSRWMAGIAEKFSPALMERLGGNGDPSDVPVFVVGMPRSGTTLVEQILASHPAVHGAGERKFLQNVVERIAGPDRRMLDFPQMMDVILPHDLPRLGQEYLNPLRAQAPGQARIVDKMPANALYAGFIHLILPRARIIYCRRDPVDTCLSCYERLFENGLDFTYDLRDLGRFCRDSETLMDHWLGILPAEAMIEVRYEDVVADLETQARRMIGFLGLDWDEACLSFHKTRRLVRTSSREQVRRPLYGSSVGRWKPYSGHLGPLLDTLGVSEV